jgi:hypothetical protein
MEGVIMQIEGEIWCGEVILVVIGTRYPSDPPEYELEVADLLGFGFNKERNCVEKVSLTKNIDMRNPEITKLLNNILEICGNEQDFIDEYERESANDL